MFGQFAFCLPCATIELGVKYLIFSLFIVGLLFVRAVFAQAPAQVAVNTQLADSEAEVGHILSVSADGLRRSASEYDTQIFGVVVASPVISVEPKGDNTKAVASTGTASVKVSTAGGNIAVGDFITSSIEPGVGQKATKSGYVLGKALSAFDGSGDNLVSVSLEIGYQQIGDPLGGGASGFFNSIVSDSSKLRLALAAIIGVVVMAGGIVAFLRLVNTGVGAIGRNPLARGTIIKSMVISGSVVVTLVGVGLAISVAIIMLGRG